MTVGNHETSAPQPIPATLKGYPVMSAIRDSENENVWTVLCQRTEQYPWGSQERYITWRAWWSDVHRCYDVENGHYGAGHGMTWQKACVDLFQRAGAGPRLQQQQQRRVVSDGPDQWGVVYVEGQAINMWVDRPAVGYLRVLLTDPYGVACGEAQLSDDGLLLSLPQQWSVEGKCQAAALITMAAYAAPQAP